MAVTITDTRTTWDEFDNEDNSGGTLYTADPDPKELTGCLGVIVSNESDHVRKEKAADVDISGNLVYVWVLANGIMDTRANGGFGVYFRDTVLTGVYGHFHIGGSDHAMFRHSSGQVGWQCLVIDLDNLPVYGYTSAGGNAPPFDFTVIEQIGAGFKTLQKALGGVENCFCDVVRYGNGGIIVTAGTSGDPGVFTEITAEDESNADGKAYGILRELGTGLFGLQGLLTFGDTAGTTATYFKDTGVTVAFEDRELGIDRYGIKVVGNSTGSTTFWLIDSTLSCPAGVGAYLDATDVDLQVLTLDNVIIAGYEQGVDFSANATNGPNHTVSGCTFIGCGQIDPGKVVFENNVIDSSTNADGSILLDADGTGDWENLTFLSDGTGHAIYITATGTYTFTEFTYSGFGADDTTNAAVYNNSGGAVTINVSGGDTPTVRNGTSASTTIVNYKTIQVKAIDANTGANIVGARVYIEAAAGGDISEGTVIATGITNSSGIYLYTTFNYTNPQPVAGRVRRATTGTLYKTNTIGGSITADGYDVLVYMIPDG